MDNLKGVLRAKNIMKRLIKLKGLRLFNLLKSRAMEKLSHGLLTRVPYILCANCGCLHRGACVGCLSCLVAFLCFRITSKNQELFLILGKIWIWPMDDIPPLMLNSRGSNRERVAMGSASWIFLSGWNGLRVKTVELWRCLLDVGCESDGCGQFYLARWITTGNPS